MKAVFFGAIGTLVETSELQRKAFNRAFVAHGIDWYWDRAQYASLLKTSGGAKRIADFAADLGETVDAKAVHATKVAIYGALLRRNGLQLRPGVLSLIRAAKDRDLAVGFVTTTGKDQSQALLDALRSELPSNTFDYIGDASRVSKSKPAPDIYRDALQCLDMAAEDVIAIEDSPSSAAAAVAAGIMTFATPGFYHTDAAFPAGVVLLDQVTSSLIPDHQIAAE